MSTPCPPRKSATQTRNPAGWDEQAAVSFPEWKEALRDANLDDVAKGSHFRAILGFLKHCKGLRCAASVAVVRDYLDLREKSGAAGHGEREGLRWFFRAARDQKSSPVRQDEPGQPDRQMTPAEVMPVPVPGALDLGSSDWEAALIREIRSRGFLWRTEQTYRGWAVRFARFLSPRNPRLAAGPDVKAFLEDLAVRGRVAASTQRQALNALVCLMQEALRIDLVLIAPGSIGSGRAGVGTLICADPR